MCLSGIGKTGQIKQIFKVQPKQKHIELHNQKILGKVYLERFIMRGVKIKIRMLVKNEKLAHIHDTCPIVLLIL